TNHSLRSFDVHTHCVIDTICSSSGKHQRHTIRTDRLELITFNDVIRIGCLCGSIHRISSSSGLLGGGSLCYLLGRCRCYHSTSRSRIQTVPKKHLIGCSGQTSPASDL